MAGSRGGGTQTVTINRAPVLTLWAAVVAERLGYDRDGAVTLGQAVAGLNAAAKARSLGIAKPREKPAVEKKAMAALAKSLARDELAAGAFSLYESFRPGIPAGVRGWGAKGVLDLAKIRALAVKERGRA